jgi:hypothetical protein
MRLRCRNLVYVSAKITLQVHAEDPPRRVGRDVRLSSLPAGIRHRPTLEYRRTPTTRTWRRTPDNVMITEKLRATCR